MRFQELEELESVSRANQAAAFAKMVPLGICHMPRGEPRRSPPPDTLRGGGLR